MQLSKLVIGLNQKSALNTERKAFRILDMTVIMSHRINQILTAKLDNIRFFQRTIQVLECVGDDHTAYEY